jgi:hypothetical protein
VLMRQLMFLRLVRGVTVTGCKCDDEYLEFWFEVLFLFLCVVYFV